MDRPKIIAELRKEADLFRQSPARQDGPSIEFREDGTFSATVGSPYFVQVGTWARKAPP